MSTTTTTNTNEYGWVYLGSRPMCNENGEQFGAVVMLKNAHNYPIEATYLGDVVLADVLTDYQPLDSKRWRVRWSSKRKKWYIFDEGGTST